MTIEDAVKIVLLTPNVLSFAGENGDVLIKSLMTDIIRSWPEQDWNLVAVEIDKIDNHWKVATWLREVIVRESDT